MRGAATEKARLPIFRLVLGTKSCLERGLEISEKSSRLTKYVGCWVERVHYVTVANLNIIRYTTGNQCNCLSSGNDGEKRGWGVGVGVGGGGGYVPRVLNNHVHVGVQISLFGNVIESSRLLIRATDTVLADDKYKLRRFDGNHVYDRNMICKLVKYSNES